MKLLQRAITVSTSNSTNESIDCSINRGGGMGIAFEGFGSGFIDAYLLIN